MIHTALKNYLHQKYGVGVDNIYGLLMVQTFIDISTSLGVLGFDAVSIEGGKVWGTSDIVIDGEVEYIEKEEQLGVALNGVLFNDIDDAYYCIPWMGKILRISDAYLDNNEGILDFNTSILSIDRDALLGRRLTRNTSFDISSDMTEILDEAIEEIIEEDEDDFDDSIVEFDDDDEDDIIEELIEDEDLETWSDDVTEFDDEDIEEELMEEDLDENEDFYEYDEDSVEEEIIEENDIEAEDSDMYVIDEDEDIYEEVIEDDDSDMYIVDEDEDIYEEILEEEDDDIDADDSSSVFEFEDDDVIEVDEFEDFDDVGGSDVGTDIKRANFNGNFDKLNVKSNKISVDPVSDAIMDALQVLPEKLGRFLKEHIEISSD